MDFSNLFSSEDPSSQLASNNGVPSIGEVKSDMINFYNIASGKAKASDWGAGLGAGAGTIIGGPMGAQLGANIGKRVLPILNMIAGPALKEIGNLGEGIVGGIEHVGSSIAHKIKHIF